jgi:outer membrane protein TolC
MGLALLAGLTFANTAPLDAQDGAQARRAVALAVVNDGPYNRHENLIDDLEHELRELLSGDFDLSLPESMVYDGDWSAAGIGAALDRALANQNADLVIATGPIGANLMTRHGSLTKPVVAAFILGPLADGFAAARDSSGVHNLNFVNARRGPRGFEVLDEIRGSGRVAIALPEALYEITPDFVNRAAAATGRDPADMSVVPVGASADEALAALPADVGTVLLTPLPQLSDVEWGRFVDGLSARSIPTFSWFGESEVEAGVLAGSTPPGFQRQLLRWVALNVQQILLGAEASSLPVEFPPQERLVINMQTADRIGVSPRWSLLISARLLHQEEIPSGRRLSLDGVIAEAMSVNLELAASDRVVAAGQDQVRLATAPLLPQVGLNADVRRIDEGRAELIPGIAEGTFTGGAGLRQLIFDERTWALRSIEGSFQKSREYDRETLGLDIQREAGLAYLKVLRAKTFERIERDNLEVTTTNLDFARLRLSAGAASLAEVYRWQAQVSQSQQGVVDTEVARSVAELEVNRILNRPLEERFDTEETTLTSPPIAELVDAMQPYIDNPRDFEFFSDFLTEEALGASPELNQLDALTEAAKRSLQSATRSFFLPQIALEAGLDNRFSENGIGSPEVGALDPLTWSAAIVFSYPLFAGTARFAEQSRASEELARVEIEREDAATRVDQRVRASLQFLRGSWVKIELSRVAAEAADNNFTLVQDAYRRGVGSILGLLDAQNQALIANEAAASAVYGFLIDLIEVERSIGRFAYFGSPQEREAFLERLETFVRQSSVRPN